MTWRRIHRPTEPKPKCGVSSGLRVLAVESDESRIGVKFTITDHEVKLTWRFVKDFAPVILTIGRNIR